ncbi:MAG: PAS domain S-box protein [Prolixibacteraceae bacterium]
MINDELTESQAESSLNARKYADLFDFAPTGYFVLSREGKLMEVNLTGAKMLGKSRSVLKNTRFSSFLTFDQRILFQTFLDRIFNQQTTDSSEFTMLSSDQQVKNIHVVGSVNQETRQCFLTVSDISDLIQTKESLLKSEKRYRTLFVDSPDAYLIIVDGVITDCNRTAENMLLMNRLEIIGKAPEDISPEFQPDGIKSSESASKKLAQALLQGKNTFEWTHRASDGSEFIVEVSIVAMDFAGKQAIFTSWRDIQARKTAERSLSDNETKFRSLFESMALGVIYQGMDGSILSANPAAENILGITIDQMQGRTSLDPRWKTIHEDGTEYPGQTHPAIVALQTGNEVTESSMGVFNPKLERYTWIKIIATPLFLSGQEKPFQVFSTFEDITEQKKAEEALKENELRFRTLADSGQALIWTAAPDKKCDYFNKVWLDFTGRTIEEELGDGWAEGVHPEDLERCFEVYSTSFEKHEPFNMAYRLRRHDGEYCWLQDSGMPRYDLHGNFLGYIGHCLEISDLINAKNALKKSEEVYRFITERSNDLIFVFRLKPEIGFEYVSPSAERITGYTVEDHYNDPELGMKMVHPDDRPLLISMQHGEIETGILRLRWIKKDGSIIWTESQNIPIYDNNGELTGIQGKATEISERVRTEQIMDTRLQLTEFAYTHSKDELQQRLLDELEKLTESNIGFFHSVNHDENSLELQSWSTNTLLHMCKAEGFGMHYSIAHAGVWAECVSARKAVIHNDYLSLTNRKGMPEGHSTVTRQLVVPVIRNEKIVAIVGIGNKSINYDNWDVEIATKLADLTWDICEVKRIEEDLFKLSQAISQSPVMTVITNLNSEIEYINPAVTKMTGYSKEELIGKNPRIFHAGTTNNKSGINLKEMLTSGKEWNGEFLNKKKDGDIYWVTASISPVINAEGKTTHYIAVEEDITERKLSEHKILELNASLEMRIERRTNQLKDLNVNLEHEIEQHKMTEMALNESREQLDLIIKGSNDAPWDWNLNSDNLYYSEKWWQQVGYAKDEIPADSNLWRTLMHPDDIDQADRILQAALESDQQSYEAEFRLFHRKGHYVPILSRGFISRDETGKPIRVTGTNLDLTERKKAEETLIWNKTLLELMSNSSPFGFLVVNNRTDEIMHFNHRFCEIWEIEHIEDQMHRGELKNNDIIPYCLPVLADIPAFAESCKPLQEEENRIVLLDLIAFTENRTIQRFSTQIRGANDEYFGRFYIFEDVTARKVAENELMEAKMEAEKANQAKSEFLSRMSHELRTPMNSILGFAQLLDMQDLNQGQKRGVGHILKAGKHLLDMINEVLDISRIEAGQLSLSIGPVNVNKLVSGMMDIVKPIATDYNISLNHINDLQEVFYVRADEQRMNQVILNLLNNAIKYNVNGGSVVVHCSLQVSSENESTEYVRISVTDTGKGISEENISRLFVPFERIGAEMSIIEGTGLGLTVVKKLLDAMGGRIGVESTPDVGSTFWIELVRSENNSETVARHIDKSSSEFQKTKRYGTILNVEDNQSSSELIQVIIENYHHGINLISASNGSQAVTLAKEYSPDLILLDLNLPDIHGKEILSILKMDDQTKHIPVIIVSADAMPIQIQALMNDGANQYLTKPINVERFNRIIHEIIPGDLTD